MSEDCPKCKILKNKLTAIAGIAGHELVPFKYPKRTPGPFETREELVNTVNTMLNKGMKGRDVANNLGISETLVSRIKHGDKKQLPNYGDQLPKSAYKRRLVQKLIRDMTYEKSIGNSSFTPD